MQNDLKILLYVIKIDTLRNNLKVLQEFCSSGVTLRASQILSSPGNLLFNSVLCSNICKYLKILQNNLQVLLHVIIIDILKYNMDNLHDRWTNDMA